MDALEFLRLVLPPQREGSPVWYIGMAIKGEHRPQESFPSIEALLAWLTNLNNQGWDVYYACAAFKERRVWDIRQQKFVRRTHDNVLSVSDLWADIDTRVSHANAPYVDQPEAAQAVARFCQSANLPSPVWVSSGGGLHVHWPLAVALGMEEWRPYALGLKAFARDYGLHIDTVRTADASSVLRPPGFHHHKLGRVVEASEAVERHPIDKFFHLKERGLSEQNRVGKLASVKPGRVESPIARLLAECDGGSPSDPSLIGRSCAQFGAFIGNVGQYSEPFHRAIGGLCKVSHDGGSEFYLSLLAPEWRSAGQAKLDSWHLDDPPTCGYIESISPRPELCKTCPHYQKITSPIVLGRQTERRIERLTQARGTPIQIAPPAQAAGEDGGLNGFPILSEPWDVHNNKLVHVCEGKNGKLDVTIVADQPVYAEGIYCSEARPVFHYGFKYKPKHDDWRTILVPAAEFDLGRGHAALREGGTLIRDPKLFGQYMKEQLGALEEAKKSGVRYEQQGFKHANRGMLWADQLYLCTPEGPRITRAMVSDEIAMRVRFGLGLRPGADPRAWMSAYNQLFPADHYCAHLNFALGLGSILHPWHTQTAGGVIIINWTPESSKGKSMILWMVGSLFGWSRNGSSIKDYDTPASQGIILAAMGNLPVLIDEIQHYMRDQVYGAQKLRELIDKVSAGTDKHRALQHGVGIRAQLGNIGQHIHCTSNQAVGELLEAVGKQGMSDTAAVNRLMELLAYPPREFDTSRGEALEAELWANGGSIGHELLKHLMREDVLGWATKELPRRYEQIWKKYGLASEHRIRVRALSSAALMGEAAFDLGLWPTSSREHLQETIHWGIEHLKGNAQLSPVQAPTDRVRGLLDAFLRKNANNTLRVEHAFKQHMMQAPIGQRPHELVVRYERSTGRAYTPYRDLKLFVIHHGGSWGEFLNQLKEQGIIINDRRKMTLGAGTEYPSVQVDCVEFDAGHPALSQTLRDSSAVPG